MVVAFVNSSNTGTSDQLVSSINVPVPASAAANHIALVHLEQWEVGNPTVTPPSGFTALTPVVSGSQKSKVFWKRLTGADSGNYTFSWTGSQWTLGHCVLLSGAVTTGDPVEAVNTATATSTSIPSTTVSTTTEAFLAHFVANENSATGTPPTNYTETQDGDYAKANYRIPGSTGSHTASGGTVSASTLMLVQLVAIQADTGGGSTQTIVCQLIAASSTIFSPSEIQITSVPIVINPSTVFSPAVTQSIAVSGPISNPSTLFNPTVVQLLQIITLALLQAPSTLFNPSVSGGGTVEMPGSISDIVRINMLADRVLTEPQFLSNVDLMRLVLADGAQTLVTKTEATAAVHLWRYLRTVRDS